MSKLLRKTPMTEPRKQRVIGRRRQEIITSVKITRALYKQVQLLAKAMDRSQSWILREAITSWVTYHAAAIEKSGRRGAALEANIADVIVNANEDAQG